jgi:hypothetical protein
MFLFQETRLPPVFSGDNIKTNNASSLKMQIDAAIAGKRKGFAGENVLDRRLANKIMLDIYADMRDFDSPFAENLAEKIHPNLNNGLVLAGMLKKIEKTEKNCYFISIGVPAQDKGSKDIKTINYGVSFEINNKNDIAVTGIYGPRID